MRSLRVVPAGRPQATQYAGHTPDLEQREHLDRGQFSALLLMATSALAIVLSFAYPRAALWAFALNLAVPIIRRATARRLPIEPLDAVCRPRQEGLRVAFTGLDERKKLT